MTLSYRDLCMLRDRGLSLSAIIVYAYVRDEGHHPPATIAQVCGLSVRSVYWALKRLARLSLKP